MQNNQKAVTMKLYGIFCTVPALHFPYLDLNKILERFSSCTFRQPGNSGEYSNEDVVSYAP